MSSKSPRDVEGMRPGARLLGPPPEDLPKRLPGGPGESRFCLWSLKTINLSQFHEVCVFLPKKNAAQMGTPREWLHATAHENALNPMELQRF